MRPIPNFQYHTEFCLAAKNALKHIRHYLKLLQRPSVPGRQVKSGCAGTAVLLPPASTAPADWGQVKGMVALSPEKSASADQYIFPASGAADTALLQRWMCERALAIRGDFPQSRARGRGRDRR